MILSICPKDNLPQKSHRVVIHNAGPAASESLRVESSICILISRPCDSDAWSVDLDKKQVRGFTSPHFSLETDLCSNTDSTTF